MSEAQEAEAWRAELAVSMPISAEAALIAYKHGHAAGVDAMRAYAAEWEKLEDVLYKIAVQMGFDPDCPVCGPVYSNAALIGEMKERNPIPEDGGA